MRVHHLTCGTLHAIGLGGRAMICHCLLVETERHGLVLVDAGFGRVDFEEPRRRLNSGMARLMKLARTPEQAAVAQVKALGFDPRDVRHVICTHMDYDHVGGLVDFPDAAVHVHAREHEAAMAPRGLVAKERYRPAMWAHGPDFHRYGEVGEPWYGFDAVRQLDGLPPEILLVPLAGHSRGHTAVAVQAQGGWLLHAGDAYFVRGEVHAAERECPPLLSVFQRIVNVSTKQRLANQTRLRTLAKESPEVTVFSAHDPSELPA